MSRRFSKSKYWLLDAAVEWEHPIARLMPPEDYNYTIRNYFGVAFNRDPHGLNYSQLLKTLINLFAEGYIHAQYFKGWEPVGETFVPSDRQIEHALHREEKRKKLLYGLTKRGGEVWEALSNPNWDLFARREEGPYPETGPYQTVEIASANREFLEAHWNRHLQDFQRAISGSEQWQVFRPWKATYWKELEVGYQLRYTRYGEQEWNCRVAANLVKRADRDPWTPCWHTDYITGEWEN